MIIYVYILPKTGNNNTKQKIRNTYPPLRRKAPVPQALQDPGFPFLFFLFSF